MYKYLIYNRYGFGCGFTWHSWGRWTSGLITVKKNIFYCISKGVDPDCVLVLEAKSPCESIYRLKKLIDGKFRSSRYFDVFDNLYSEGVCRYLDTHISDYIGYRHDDGSSDDLLTPFDWVVRNDSAIRDLILWLYDNNYITIS